VTEQTSSGLVSSVDDNAKLVALQLGNTYGLVFLIAIAVLYTTSEIKVVRNYLVACWLADISHVYVCYHVLGWASFVDVAHWNAMTAGNVGATVSSVPTIRLHTSSFCTAWKNDGSLDTDHALLDEKCIFSGAIRARCSRSSQQNPLMMCAQGPVPEWSAAAAGAGTIEANAAFLYDEFKRRCLWLTHSMYIP
jgi:hypothetical protein